MSRWKDLNSNLNKYLRLSTFPVGVKLLEKEDNLENVKHLKQPEEDLALCQIFSYSRYYAWTMGCNLDRNLCPLASIAIGYEEPYGLFTEGAFFVGRYNETKEAAKKTTESMPLLPSKRFKAIISGALERIEFEPDIILIWGNSAQIMRIIQASLWKKGGRFTMSTFCDGVCADIISNVILTGELQVAFPCLGDRRFGLAKDSDLIASIPFDVINDILVGLEKTHKAGTRYPIPYQLCPPAYFIKLKKQLDKARK